MSFRLSWTQHCFQDVTIDPDRITIILYSHFHHDHIQGLPFNFGIFLNQMTSKSRAVWLKSQRLGPYSDVFL